MQPIHRTGRTGRRLARVVMAVCLMAVSWTVLRAQTDTGRVTGTVADATGALIPGASITLTDIDTGIVQTRTTSNEGSFNFPAVALGHYRIETTAKGVFHAEAGVRTANATGADARVQVGDRFCQYDS